MLIKSEKDGEKGWKDLALPKFLIDTSLFVDLVREQQEALNKLKILGKQGELCYSQITTAELFFGCRTKKEIDKVRLSFLKLTHYPLSEEIMIKAGILRKKYSPKLNKKLPDALIAATALTHEAILVTHNLKDFQLIKDLKVLKPY